MKFHLLHHKSLDIHAAQGQRGFSVFSSVLHFLAKSETHIRAKEKEKAVSVLLKVFAQMYQVTLEINLINMTPVSAAVIV